MTAYGADEIFRRADFLQHGRCFQAVAVRIFFKVHVVQQADHGPEVGIAAVFERELAHDGLDRKRMADVEGFGVVFFQQSERLVTGEGKHRDLL